MPNSRPFDHLFNGKFGVEIDGLLAATFVACDGLEAQVDVVRFADAAVNTTQERKRPGRAHYANIVLRRGLTTNGELWTWFKATLDGLVQRKAGAILLCGDDGSELMRYNFYEGWPCRWKSLQLNTENPGTLIEELEIAVEKIERA
jgi:phage tail-like protein